MARKPYRKKDDGTLEEVVFPISSIDGLQSALNNKLDKLTYEWNKQLACGSNGKVRLLRIPVYDTNITLDISSTTSTTYSGKLVIATQNGNVGKATVYGDASGTLANSLVIVKSATGVSQRSWLDIYGNFSGWSKNIVHTIAVAPYITGDFVAYPDIVNVDTIPTGNVAISNDIQSYVDGKGYITESNAKSYTDTAVANLVNSAPEALNTLGELATALQEHENEYDALLQTVGGKYVKPSGGIPKTDLASAVQSSLSKADTALQTETYKGTVTQVNVGSSAYTPSSGVISLPAYPTMPTVPDTSSFATKSEIRFYGTCSTASTTVAKTVTIDGFTSVNLVAGTRIMVYMTYTHNSTSNATLNVSGTGAKTIYTADKLFVNTTSNTTWNGADYLEFMYDGTYWVWVNSYNQNAGALNTGTLKASVLPYAVKSTSSSTSSGTKGAVRIRVYNSNLYIYTS